MTPTIELDPRTRLRQGGQANLGAWIRTATGEKLWSVQAFIALAASRYRSRVAVPSCNASGKTWLAARIALAFYDSFAPGTPCVLCGGPCGGSKVVTTSSKFEHLKDNLWGEIRTVHPRLVERVGMGGRLYEGDNLRLEDSPSHFIVGHNPKATEGMQGYHAAHKLIIGDEATALDEELTSGITGLLASGDSRLFLIANPTTAETWFATEANTEGTELVRIKAWDTPLFTGEDHPPGAALITPEFLDYLKAHGMGPGTYEWTTRVEAEFWTVGEDVLIPDDWYGRALGAPTEAGAGRQLGIDMATYGSAENVICWREGSTILRVDAFPAMRQELFWSGPVLEATQRFEPHWVVYDADGVGAGVSGEADRLRRHMTWGGQVLGFRGALKTASQYHNARSAWYWALRKRFERPGGVTVAPVDHKLRAQLTNIKYGVTAAGAIKVETKEEMKRRGKESPDRADAVMYAFAFSEDLPTPTAPSPAATLTQSYGVEDRSEDAMWRRDLGSLDRRRLVDAVWGTPLDW